MLLDFLASTIPSQLFLIVNITLIFIICVLCFIGFSYCRKKRRSLRDMESAIAIAHDSSNYYLQKSTVIVNDTKLDSKEMNYEPQDYKIYKNSALETTIDSITQNHLLNNSETQIATAIVIDNTRADSTFNMTTTRHESDSKVYSIPLYLKVVTTETKVVAKIGHGGAGEIFQVETNDADLRTRAGINKIAMKTYKQEDIRSFFQEVCIMSMFRDSKYFATIIGYQEERFQIFMIYYPLGSLKTWISKKVETTLKNSFDILHGLFNAIYELHNHGVSHNDVKPDNILLEVQTINGENRLISKLTDFGVSNLFNSAALKVKGVSPVQHRGLSYAYAAPERLIESFTSGFASIAKKADIYSSGIIIFELVTLEKPWVTGTISILDVKSKK